MYTYMQQHIIAFSCSCYDGTAVFTTNAKPTLLIATVIFYCTANIHLLKKLTLSLFHVSYNGLNLHGIFSFHITAIYIFRSSYT